MTLNLEPEGFDYQGMIIRPPSEAYSISDPGHRGLFT